MKRVKINANKPFMLKIKGSDLGKNKYIAELSFIVAHGNEFEITLKAIKP